MNESFSSTALVGKRHAIFGPGLRYSASHTGPLALASVVAIATSFVSATLFTRLLTPTDYGKYSFIWTWIGVLSMLSLPGLAIAVQRATTLGHEGTLVAATAIRLRWSLLGSGALVAGALFYLTAGSDTTMAFGFAAAALIFPGYCAFDNYLSYLAGKKQFGRQAAWRITSLVVAGLFTWAVLVSFPRVALLILVSAGSIAVVQSIAYWRGVRTLRSASSQEGAIRYGKRLSLLGLIGVIEARVDALLVGSLLSFASLAQYRVAETVVDATAKRVWLIVSQPFFPRWAGADESTAYRRLLLDMTAVIFLLAIAFIVLFFLIPSVFPVLFTDRYEPAIRLAQILVLASLVSLPGAAADLFLTARQIEIPQWILRITTTGVHLALLPFFIPVWGVTGIVLAVLCSRVAYTLTGLELVRRSAIRENASWR